MAEVQLNLLREPTSPWIMVLISIISLAILFSEETVNFLGYNQFHGQETIYFLSQANDYAGQAQARQPRRRPPAAFIELRANTPGGICNPHIPLSALIGFPPRRPPSPSDAAELLYPVVEYVELHHIPRRFRRVPLESLSTLFPRHRFWLGAVTLTGGVLGLASDIRQIYLAYNGGIVPQSSRPLGPYTAWPGRQIIYRAQHRVLLAEADSWEVMRSDLVEIQIRGGDYFDWRWGLIPYLPPHP